MRSHQIGQPICLACGMSGTQEVRGCSDRTVTIGCSNCGGWWRLSSGKIYAAVRPGGVSAGVHAEVAGPEEGVAR